MSSNSDFLKSTETWLNDSVSDEEVLADLPNFQPFRKDRKDKKGGGVIIAINQKFTCSLVNLSSDLEMIWILCSAKLQSVLLGVCYRPPNSCPDFSNNLNDVLNEVTKKPPNAPVVLFGDFNFPGINWLNQTMPSQAQGEAGAFLDVCLNFNLSQMVTVPTRVTQECENILDLILTSHPDDMVSITYLPEISDHKTIHTEFAFKPLICQNTTKTIRFTTRAIMKQKICHLTHSSLLKRSV